MQRREVIIAYDVQSNKRRRSVHRCLCKWRLDSQYSVFECRLSAREAEELFLQLTALIDEKGDKLMLAWLDKSRPARGLTSATELGFQAASCYKG
jgi:CRISPR-associated endonuclease Cas2